MRLAAPLALTLLAAAGAAAADPGPAPAPGPVIVRGTVEAVSPSSLLVRTREGRELQVALARDWTAQATRPVTAEQIKEGSFIGTAEMPQRDGAGRSLEVHVFPPGVKLGEGHYGWDLRKGSMMTNGTVGKVVRKGGGRELDVTYATGERRIVVPAGVPIVQIEPADRAAVARGARVFLIAAPTPGGLAANAVAVGVNGQAPPM